MKNWIALFFFFCCSLHACTAFQLRSQDGAILYCRTLEFGFPLQSEILIVPRGTEYAGTTPFKVPGLRWKAKYGFIGLNQTMAPNLVNDGMNEKGLVVGALYLPGFAKYESPSQENADRTLGAWELPSYLLSACATVKEVKDLLSNVLVAQQIMPQFFGELLPLHFQVSDSKGETLVIEYVAGERHVYDNPIGVLTNSPPFDWQMTHLSNYVNLSPVNVSSSVLRNDYKVRFYGQGSGLLGLPGDYSPPSRFVRAALFSSYALAPQTAIGAVRLAFHLLNSFDIPDGLIQPSPQESKQKGAKPSTDKTQWVVVHDQTNRKTYVRTYESLAIQMIDLKQTEFSEPGLRQIPIKKEFSFENITDNSKPLNASR